MRKLLSLAAAAVAFATPAMAAVTVTFSPGGTLPAGSVIIQDFNSLAAGTSLGTNAQVYATSVNGVAARPAVGSDGNFAAVRSGGSYSLDFGPAMMFSFILGSVDAGNLVTVRLADGTTQAFTGSQLNGAPSADGNQTSNLTNGVVTFTTTGPAFIGATFSSSVNSFEFDNLAETAAVPEPATWAMMLLGFGAVGASMRRKRPSATPAIA